jgi:hypothetical protein
MILLPQEIIDIIIFMAHPRLPDDLQNEIKNFEFEQEPEILEFSEFYNFLQWSLAHGFEISVTVSVNDELLEFNF